MSANTHRIINLQMEGSSGSPGPTTCRFSLLMITPCAKTHVPSNYILRAQRSCGGHQSLNYRTILEIRRGKSTKTGPHVVVAIHTIWYRRIFRALSLILEYGWSGTKCFEKISSCISNTASHSIGCCGRCLISQPQRTPAHLFSRVEILLSFIFTDFIKSGHTDCVNPREKSFKSSEAAVEGKT